MEQLARQCVYVEQGKSGKAGAEQRPLFEQMKRDAGARKFNRLLVWKVSRLGRDMREVISTVYELADLNVTVVPPKSQTGPRSGGSRMSKACFGKPEKDLEHTVLGFARRLRNEYRECLLSDEAARKFKKRVVCTRFAGARPNPTSALPSAPTATHAGGVGVGSDLR